jgi:Ca-activated chloride channel family protein
VDEIDTYLIFGGTAIGDALESAVELGKRVTDEDVPEGGQIALGDSGATRTLAQATDDAEDEEKGPVSILFLSDGAQTRGILQPLEGAALAQDARIPVYTIALGTPEGVIDRGNFGGGFGVPDDQGTQLIPVPPDPVTLRQIAEMTGGEFKLSSSLGREPGESEVTFFFVALAAVLLLLAGGLATFLAPRLP